MPTEPTPEERRARVAEIRALKTADAFMVECDRHAFPWNHAHRICNFLLAELDRMDAERLALEAALVERDAEIEAMREACRDPSCRVRRGYSLRTGND